MSLETDVDEKPIIRVGAGGGIRTHDLTITNRLRFQLRHTGVAHRLVVVRSDLGVVVRRVAHRCPEGACVGAPLRAG